MDSLLTLQSDHRSSVIWNGDKLSDTIRPRRKDSGFWRHLRDRPLHDCVRHYFNTSGFGGLIEAGRIQYDWALITALLERWRPETHTFHFRCGEATITLQDVEVLYGLPVDGRPVVALSRDRTPEQWQEEMHRLTGFRPLDTDFDCRRLRITAFEAYIHNLPAITPADTDEVVQQRFRTYLLWIFGGILFPDKSGNLMSLRLLPLLDSVCDIGSYSWGSAVLAYLYWAMCRASMKDTSHLCGFTALLQVWAWERLLLIQPMLRPPAGNVDPDVEVNRMVYAQKWKGGVHRDAEVRLYRGIFDGMTPNQFIWKPYDNQTLARCYQGRRIWMAEVPLICDKIVEHHVPSRVLRQFGFQQGVPLPVPFHDTHFKKDQRHKFDEDCRRVLEGQIQLWEQRSQKVVIVEPAVGMIDDIDPQYMTWYHQITRTLIGNPDDQTAHGYQAFAGGHEPLARGLDYIYRQALQMQKPDNLTSSHEWGRRLAAIASESLLAATQGRPLSFDTDYDPASAYHHSPSKNQHRRGGAARNHGRGHGVGRGADAGRDAPLDHHLVEDDVDNPAPYFPPCPSSTPLRSDIAAHSAHVATLTHSAPDAYRETHVCPPLSGSIVSVSASASSTLSPPTSIPSPPKIPISWPKDETLTLDWVTDLMLAFDWASRNLPPSELPSVLPIEAFDRLIWTALKILHKEPNYMQIDNRLGLGPNSRMVVVGDVHGQLHDVLFLLRDAGVPAEDQFFVFNGDYVDRGAWGLETFLLLLAWKAFMPNRVFLLRGNHESKYCTSFYGFEAEVLAKYADKGKHVYRKCLECFKELPLASIIGGNVYTAHGGIFRSIPVLKKAKRKKNDEEALTLGSLEELLKARRSVLDPPCEGKNLIPGDVLWSDPSMKLGLSLNEERGMGLLWGPDVTEEFLKKSNLKLIIRSHEGPDAREKRDGLGRMDKGYTIDHVGPSGKLITLFSAPDYPQFQATEKRYQNKGAYIILKPPNFDEPVYHSFEAVTPRPEVEAYYEYQDVPDSDEELDLEKMVTDESGSASMATDDDESC